MIFPKQAKSNDKFSRQVKSSNKLLLSIIGEVRIQQVEYYYRTQDIGPGDRILTPVLFWMISDISVDDNHLHNVRVYPDTTSQQDSKNLPPHQVDMRQQILIVWEEDTIFKQSGQVRSVCGARRRLGSLIHYVY